MPSWSGLNDRVHGAPYAPIQARPPITGLLKLALRRRGLHPWAELLGGTIPDTYKRVTGASADLTVRGAVGDTMVIKNAGLAFTGTKRTLIDADNLDDPAPTATQIGDVADQPLKPLDSMNGTKAYPADKAANGVTGPAW